MDEQSCLVVKLSNYIQLSEKQKTLLSRFEEVTKEMDRGDSFEIHPERDTGNLFVVKRGWCLLKRLNSDAREGICRVYLPGDIVGLETLCVKAAERKFQAASPLTVCPFSSKILTEIFGEDPQLASLFFYVLGRDTLIAEGVLSCVLLLPATKRLGYYLLLLGTRLQDLGAVRENQFHFRLNQIELGEAISLSQQQVNRSFRELREDGLVVYDKKKIHILDRSRLEELCDFDPKIYKLSINEMGKTPNS